MVKVLKLYKDNLKYIENSFKYDINNGIIEGTNNLIKCLKRIAFGYRKFDHFIARIFLIKGIIKEWLKITLSKQSNLSNLLFTNTIWQRTNPSI